MRPRRGVRVLRPMSLAIQNQEPRVVQRHGTGRPRADRSQQGLPPCRRAAPEAPANTSGNSVWRRGRDSNPRYPCEYAAFRVRCIRPLCHLSIPGPSEGAEPTHDAALTQVRPNDVRPRGMRTRPHGRHIFTLQRNYCESGAFSGCGRASAADGHQGSYEPTPQRPAGRIGLESPRRGRSRRAG